MMHKNLDPKIWQSYSLAFQLGNIGAEVSRALRSKQQNDQQQAETCLNRALELLDLTISFQKSSSVLAELTRLRELMCDKVYNTNKYAVTDSQLNNYFLPFAILARK